MKLIDQKITTIKHTQEEVVPEKQMQIELKRLHKLNDGIVAELGRLQEKNKELLIVCEKAVKAFVDIEPSVRGNEFTILGATLVVAELQTIIAKMRAG